MLTSIIKHHSFIVFFFSVLQSNRLLDSPRISSNKFTMKFTTTALVALSARVAFSATIALAARAADVALDKRATQGAYLCTDRDFKGHCVDIKSEASACVPLGADLNDKVSSVGPDKGSLCYFFV
jgi:hypothetical protein